MRYDTVVTIRRLLLLLSLFTIASSLMISVNWKIFAAMMVWTMAARLEDKWFK